MRRMERSLEELYADDPERADALVFGRTTGVSRRGFVGGAGLAAMSAAVGGPIVYARQHAGRTHPGGTRPGRQEGGRQRRAAAAPRKLDFPGKDAKLVVLSDAPLVAEAPEHLLDDETTPTARFFIRNNGQIPEAAADPDVLAAHDRRRGQQALRDHPGRARRSARSPKTLRMVAGSRRQRPLVLHAAGARAPSGPTAASAAPNGPACRSAIC